jgi:hypothetical protein
MPTTTQVHNHAQAVAAAKGVLQAALAGASVAAAKAAHITYYKAVLASARLNAHQTGALKALQSLGVDVTDGRDGDT